MSIGRKNDIKKKTVAIMGPTASGKSALAIEIAREYDGEIVSVDSRQVYRHMDIGTGKVRRDTQPRTANDQRATQESGHCKSKVGSWKSTRWKLEVGSWRSENIPHHLLDVAEPNDDYNISHFLRDARAAVDDISGRGKLPILCGGTGFWMQAFVEDTSLPEVPPDPELRTELETHSKEELVRELASLDPKRAETIDRENPRRLIRAIEIARFSQQSTNNKQQTTNNDQRQITLDSVNCYLLTVDCLTLALCPPKSVLDTKIKARLDERFDEGMIDEVRSLREAHGVSWERLESFGLEYRWIARFLRGLVSESDMRERLFYDIVHYAKRQMTWIRRWRKTNPSLRVVETKSEALELARDFLKE